MIQKLNDVYLVNDKLLYVSDDFIGFDPIISEGLNFERMIGSNNSIPKSTKVKVEDFKIEGQEYTAILLSVLTHGPLKGYKRIEILLNGKLIINHQYGSHGFGCNYREGRKFLIKNDVAFVILEGNQFKEKKTGLNLLPTDITSGDFHLLKFNNFILPKELEPEIIQHKLEDKKLYEPKDIEFLRQVDWTAVGKIDEEVIEFVQTSIHNMNLSPNGKFEVGGNKNYLHQLEINFKQEQFTFGK